MRSGKGFSPPLPDHVPRTPGESKSGLPPAMAGAATLGAALAALAAADAGGSDDDAAAAAGAAASADAAAAEAEAEAAEAAAAADTTGSLMPPLSTPGANMRSLASSSGCARATASVWKSCTSGLARMGGGRLWRVAS